MNKLRNQLLLCGVTLRRALMVYHRTWRPALLLGVLLLIVSDTMAQTTAFTYQGKLNDNGNPASSSYDMQFRLFDNPNAGQGTQHGATITNPNVQVSGGIFTVQLDFGAAVFASAAPLYLEVSLRLAGSTGGYTSLAPRQPVTSSPYAVQSLNATNATNAAQLGGVAANQFVVTTDARLSDARPPTTGSVNYVQNTTSPQAASNFNISGNGAIGGNLNVGGALSLNIVNAQTQFNLGGSRILSNAGTGNLFAGVFAGNNSTGSGNAFFGPGAGNNNGGNNNAFFGNSAGNNNGGNLNAFFGDSTGSGNTGSGNAFFGNSAGNNNGSGNSNTFIGGNARFALSSTGGNNTLLGSGAVIGGVFPSTINNATAIGYRAAVERSNSIVLGSINGANGATADTNVGIGTTFPTARLQIKDNDHYISFGDAGCGPGFIGIGFFSSLLGCENYAMLGGDGNTYINRNAGGTIFFREANDSNQVTIKPGGFVTIESLGSSGSTALCRNAALEISTCSSSLRYKTAIQPFVGGLEVIKRLRPITFTWKEGGRRDVGFGAEEVEKVEPLLTFRNNRGEVEGVKYDRITVALVNAVREQQTQIEQQRQRIAQQQAQIKQQQQEIETLKRRHQEFEALKRLVCTDHPRAAVCKSN